MRGQYIATVFDTRPNSPFGATPSRPFVLEVDGQRITLSYHDVSRLIDELEDCLSEYDNKRTLQSI